MYYSMQGRHHTQLRYLNLIVGGPGLPGKCCRDAAEATVAANGGLLTLGFKVVISCRSNKPNSW